MQLTNKEQEILSTYQKWIKSNNERIKSDNEKWQFYIKILDERFIKSFLLEEILKIEKDFVLKTIKEKSNL